MALGRPAPQFIRIEEHQQRWTISLARTLWSAIGAPATVTLQHEPERFVIIAVTERGYNVTGGTSTPRVQLRQEQAKPLGLPLGHYHAAIHNGQIVTTFERDPENGRRVYLVQQRGQWRICTNNTGGVILWHAEAAWHEEEVMSQAQAWCEQRDYRLVKPPQWE